MIEFILLIISMLLVVFIVNTYFTTEFIYKITNGSYGYLEKELSKYSNEFEFLEHEKEYKELQLKMWDLNNMNSYFKLLFHYKPFNFEYWFSIEDAKLLEEGLEYYNKKIK